MQAPGGLDNGVCPKLSSDLDGMDNGWNFLDWGLMGARIVRGLLLFLKKIFGTMDRF
jgi:hypothetical protein